MVAHFLLGLRSSSPGKRRRDCSSRRVCEVCSAGECADYLVAGATGDAVYLRPCGGGICLPGAFLVFSIPAIARKELPRKPSLNVNSLKLWLIPRSGHDGCRGRFFGWLGYRWWIIVSQVTTAACLRMARYYVIFSLLIKKKNIIKRCGVWSGHGLAKFCCSGGLRNTDRQWQDAYHAGRRWGYRESRHDTTSV